MDEFQLIRELLKSGKIPASGVRVGPGDDAAVVRPRKNRDLVITTDAQVEGVHFTWDWLSPRDVGYKAAMACLSDLAAMGANPWILLSNLSIPPKLSVQHIKEVQKGLTRALEATRTCLVGGNVTGSKGDFSMVLTAIGTIPQGSQVERKGALAGDRIWISGDPGRAALGLHHFLQNRPGPAYTVAFRRPVARIGFGMSLRKSKQITSMIDISDGLAGDLAHLLGEKLGARLDLDVLIPNPGFSRRCRLLNLDPIQLVLHGGEDYELLFTVPPGLNPCRIQTIGQKHNLKVRQVGEIERKPGIRLFSSGNLVHTLPDIGFQHHFEEVVQESLSGNPGHACRKYQCERRGTRP